ncbi:TPA: hypothetical protein SLZ46_001911 [Vibrio cholerae]|uniref:hypothetical protein n=1 Tax=Vibrio cholerae TaxID=666 RepID=UPI00129AA32E|nr:hypothetical protein [Vibrio cholerae]MRI14841.1 hypothetical protein [Vibrio cholerae]HEJ2464916.1 hypothetical protein [Vibrio cholerae]
MGQPLVSDLGITLLLDVAAALATFVLPHSLSGLMGMNVLAALLAVILQRSFVWEWNDRR